MVCVYCNKEMIKSKKFKINSCHNIKGVVDELSCFNKDVGLYAISPYKNLRRFVSEGVFEQIIKLDIYVCTGCGHVEIKLPENQIKLFVDIENDDSYIDIHDIPHN